MHHFGRNIESFKKLITIVKRSLFQRRSRSQIALVISNLDIWKLLYSAVDLDITFWSRMPLILLFKYTGYFTSDNEPGEIGNATHNTFPKLTWLF
jgi:hypothetical protein